jgi:predicted RNA-binding Zn-ribbon protein involved in translation (DUF1610 family)
MKRKTLANFIKPLTVPPLYSTAKTGQIVVSENKEPIINPCPWCGSPTKATTFTNPAFGEATISRCTKCQKATGKEPPTGAEHSEPLPILPELRGGELLINPRSGKTYRVHRVANKGQFASAYDEKLYRLENVVIGNRRWTLEEMAEQGLKLVE